MGSGGKLILFCRVTALVLSENRKNLNQTVERPANSRDLRLNRDARGTQL